MGIRSAIATALEGAAAALRRSERPAASLPSPANDTAPARVRRIPPKAVPPHPEGFWLCTVSTFDDFLVGHAYPAIRNGSGVRVFPFRGSTWAPYWQFDEGRFCYPEHQLDFTYLGAVLPDGHPVDARSERQRTEARLARRAATA